MTSNGKRRRSRWKWARWLAVALSVGGVIYLLVWYVPDVLVKHKVDTSVESAWISAVATLLGVGATAAVAIFAFWYSRSTNQATIDAANVNLKDQGMQLDKTLTAQREQLESTLAEQRTRTLNERFAMAAGQLGDDKPAVRLAGVYAMAGLADDWPENRQSCVDVLCAYLRLPYDPDPGDDAGPAERAAYRVDREVRHTVIRVIAAHLKAGAAVSWQGRDFDFTGVVFDGGDFTTAEFSGGTVRLTGAEFFGGNVYFTGAKFSGSTVSFLGAKFAGSAVSFVEAEFSGGEVFFGAEFSEGYVNFVEAEFSGGEVFFNGAEFSGGEVFFIGTKFSGGTVDFGGGTLDFDGRELSGGESYFDDAKFSGGTVDFSGAEFSGGTVDFSAKFSGGRPRPPFSAEVSFNYAEFSGGTVDFSSARDWSVPPTFPWTDTPPLGVKLPKKEDQSQA